MKKKKMNLWMILLIFFVVQCILASLLKYDITLGPNPETGKFGLWFNLSELTTIDKIQHSIQTDLFPDVYMKDNSIEGAEKYAFTYGSKKIYDFFHFLFHEESPFKFFGEDSGILNFRLWRMLFFLNIFFLCGAIYLRKKLSFIPTKVQVVCETLYTFFYDMIRESLGDKAQKFFPFYMTLFLFIWIANLVGMLPIPGISEPTRNLNAPLGLGIMAIMMVQYYSFKKKGFVAWGKEFLEPFFVMLPLNIVGELSRIVSVSFRLFGNIFGGGIIGLVVCKLIMDVTLPVGLTMFFTMFGGTIQAFVFTMLTLTFLSLAITDQ
jgi:F-type H+-transporting ATPase subunit a